MVEGVSKALWIVVATMSAAVASLAPVARGQQVPCYFVFGDSVFENGNTNDLDISAKANYLPYGIDFPQGPTGRFSNGRNIADFIAELVGFNHTIPPFRGASREQANIGINYASGFCQILMDSLRIRDVRNICRDQLNKHRWAIRNASVPLSRLRQCLYIFSMGTNDYLNSYFSKPPAIYTRLADPDAFAMTLITIYGRHLHEMRLLGARKVAVFGIGKLGCTPRIIARLGDGSGGCVEEVNQAVKIFNNHLKILVEGLLGDMFTYVDVFAEHAKDVTALGITVGNRSCCAVKPGKELCAANGAVCPDRTKYLYWDDVHTTETINAAVANAAFNGKITSPYSISQIVNGYIY